MSWEQHSKVYFESAAPLDDIVRRIHQHIGGQQRPSGVDGPTLTVYVDDNDERDPVRAADPRDGFLYFPYLIDVDGSPGASTEAYQDALSALLRQLASPNIRFVTAANNEPALLGGGRWNGLTHGGAWP